MISTQDEASYTPNTGNDRVGLEELIGGEELWDVTRSPFWAQKLRALIPGVRLIYEVGR